MGSVVVVVASVVVVVASSVVVVVVASSVVVVVGSSVVVVVGSVGAAKENCETPENHTPEITLEIPAFSASWLTSHCYVVFN